MRGRDSGYNPNYTLNRTKKGRFCKGKNRKVQLFYANEDCWLSEQELVSSNMQIWRTKTTRR